jgi:hypothetical protein
MHPLLPTLLFALAGDQDAPRSDDEALDQAALVRLAADVREQIGDLRGKPFKRPVEVRLADRDAFVAYARETVRARGGEQRLRDDERIAKLLGLVSGDADLQRLTMDVLEEQVGGFYDPPSETFYVMDTIAPELARVIMSHELTHALDDQYHDLDGLDRDLEGNADAQLALHAVMEGSAQVLMERWLGTYASPEDRAALSGMQDSLTGDTLALAPPLVWKPYMASYFQGQAFLQRQARLSVLPSSARLNDIERAFIDPPRSTEQVLHPVKYWDARRRDDPLVLRADVRDLPDGWEVLREDTLGELHLALLTTPFDERGGMQLSPLAILQLRFTNDAASGWGGDRFVLLGKSEAHLLRLVTRWDTPDEAQEFVDALHGLHDDIVGAKAQAPGYAAAAAGLRVARTLPDEVTITSWTGLTVDEAERLLAAVRFEVVVEDE